MENKFLQLLHPEEIVATSGGLNLNLINEGFLINDISSILEPIVEYWFKETTCPCPCYSNDTRFMDKFFPRNKSKEEEKKDEFLKKECCCHPLFV